MQAITALRPFLPAPRRGTLAALLIAVVVASLVSMHSLCGAPSAGASVHTAHHHAAELQTTHGPAAEPHAHDHDHQHQHQHQDGCECHGTTSTCLMVLASLPALTTPSVCTVDGPTTSLAHRPPPTTGERTAGQPSLHALGISRT